MTSIENGFDRKKQNTGALTRLSENVNSAALAQSFNKVIGRELATDQKIHTSLTTALCIGGARISHKDIQQQMYPQGYRRVVRPEEIGSLAKRYHVGEDLLTHEGNKFFAPAFPEDGADSLVIIHKTSTMLYIGAYASRKDIRETTDRFVADKNNSTISKPAISSIDFNDNKGKSNLAEAQRINHQPAA